MDDILVVGGGPAGLVSAIVAARAGYAVRILEPKPGVIDKACGEGLMPAAVRALEALSIRPTGHPFQGIRYVWGADQADAPFRQGEGLGVRRLSLHGALLAAAESAGVAWAHTRVGAVEQTDSTVSAGGLSGRWLIAADGLRSPIRAQLGLARPARMAPRVGVRRHFSTPPWSPFVEVHWSPHAEAYVTPVSDSQVGVAFLYRSDQPPDAPGIRRYDALLAQFPTLRERLGAPCSQVRGAGPFEQRVVRRVSGRILLVGDAAGYVDPLTGEGLKLGVLQAQAAVQAIQGGVPESYEGAWRRITRSYRWSTTGLLKLTQHPWCRRQLVPVLRRAPWLMTRAVATLDS